MKAHVVPLFAFSFLVLFKPLVGRQSCKLPVHPLFFLLWLVFCCCVYFLDFTEARSLSAQKKKKTAVDVATFIYGTSLIEPYGRF